MTLHRDAPIGFICSSSIHIYNVDGVTRELVMSRMLEFPEGHQDTYSSKSFSSVCLHANLGKLFAISEVSNWEWELPSAE